jgi:hypothetical protein
MLEGVEAKVGLSGGVGVAVDGDDAAFFVELVACGDNREQGTGIRDQGIRDQGIRDVGTRDVGTRDQG